MNKQIYSCHKCNGNGKFLLHPVSTGIAPGPRSGGEGVKNFKEWFRHNVFFISWGKYWKGVYVHLELLQI